MIGIYKILNLKTNKYYIGSSKDILNREKYHFSRLKNNKHFNSHLQNSFNKYGLDNFKFEIIEKLNNFNKIELLKREQYHINEEKESNLYNLTYITNGGGSDVLSIPVHLLNLSGEVIETYISISEASRELNCKISKQINGRSIIGKKYRLVTVEFYNKNKKIIKSWKRFSSKRSSEINRVLLKRILLLQENDKILEFKNRKEVSKYLNITTQAVDYLIKNKKSIIFKFPELNK